MTSPSRPPKPGIAKQPPQEPERGRSHQRRRGSFAGSDVTRTTQTRRSRSQSLSRIARDQAPTFEDTVSTSTLTERRTSLRRRSSIMADREKMEGDRNLAVNTILKKLHEMVQSTESATKDKIAKFLKDIKINVDPTVITDEKGETIFLKVIKHYSQQCHTETDETKRQRILINCLITFEFDAFTPNNEGLNPLHCIILSKNFALPENKLRIIAEKIYEKTQTISNNPTRSSEYNKLCQQESLTDSEKGQKAMLEHVRTCVNQRNPEGNTLLTALASQGEFDTFKWAIKTLDADPDATNSDDQTPLYVSTALNKDDDITMQENKFKIAQLLLNSSARLEPRPSKTHRTVLHNLVDHGLSAAQDLLDTLATPAADGSSLLSHQVPHAEGESKSLLNTQDKRGFTALMQACSGEPGQQRTELVSYLIANGADVTCSSNTQQQALTIALRKQFPLEVIKQLLEAGANASHVTEAGETPLRLACASYEGNIVSELVKHGADIDETDQQGLTALWRALTRGSVERVEFLLKFDPDVNFLLNQQSPLEYLFIKAHKAPADLDTARKQRTTARGVLLHFTHKLLQAGAQLTPSGALHTIPQVLMELSDTNMVCEMLTQCLPYGKPDVWAVRSNDGKQTLLSRLLTLARKNEGVTQLQKLFETIIEQGTALDTRFGSDAMSLLMLAAQMNSEHNVLLLCRAPDQLMPNKKQATIDQTDLHGNTALHYACMAGTADKDILTTLNHLIANHADLSIANEDGKLAVDFAIEHGNIGAIKLLTRQSTLSLKAAKAIASANLEKRIKELQESASPASETELLAVLKEAQESARAVISAHSRSEEERTHAEQARIQRESQRIRAELKQDTQKEKDALVQSISEHEKKIQQTENAMGQMKTKHQELEKQIAETRNRLAEKTTAEKTTQEQLTKLQTQLQEERSRQEQYQDQLLEAGRQIAEDQNTITLLTERLSETQPQESATPDGSAPAMPVVQSGQDTADDEFTIDIALGAAKIPEKVRFRFSTDTTESSEPTEILLSTQPDVAAPAAQEETTAKADTVDKATSAQPITREVASSMGSQQLAQTTEQMAQEVERLTQILAELEIQQVQEASTGSDESEMQQKIDWLAQQLVAAEDQLQTLQDALRSQEQQPPAAEAAIPTATTHAVAQTTQLLGEEHTRHAVMIKTIKEVIERLIPERRAPLSLFQPGKMLGAFAESAEEVYTQTFTDIFRMLSPSPRAGEPSTSSAGRHLPSPDREREAPPEVDISTTAQPSLELEKEASTEETERSETSTAMTEEQRDAMLSRRPAVFAVEETLKQDNKELVTPHSDPEFYTRSEREHIMRPAISEDLQYPYRTTDFDEPDDSDVFPVDRQESSGESTTASPGDSIDIVTRHRSDTDITTQIAPTPTSLDYLDLAETSPNQIAATVDKVLSAGTSFARTIDTTETVETTLPDEDSSGLLAEATALPETVESGHESPFTEIPGMSPTMLSQSDLFGDDKSDAEQSGTVRRGAAVTAEQLQKAWSVSDVFKLAGESSSDGSSSSSGDSNERSSSELSPIPEDPAVEGAAEADQATEIMIETEIEGERVTLRVIADDENGETEV